MHRQTLSSDAVARADLGAAADSRLDAELRRELAQHRVYPKHVAALRRVCAHINGTCAGLLTLGVPGFSALERIQGYHSVRNIVRQAYLGLGGDPHALSNTGARVLADHPQLVDWPVAAARWLEDRVTDAADRAHLVHFLVTVDEHLARRRPERIRANSRRSLFERASSTLFRVVGAMGGGADGAFRRTMPYDLDDDGMRTFAARVLLEWLRSPCARAKRTTNRLGESRSVKALLDLLKTATVAGVFPNVTLRADTFALRSIRERMEELVGVDGLAALEDERASVGGARPNGTPGDDAVDRLRRAAARDPRDRLMLALLSTTGLRVRAVCRLTVGQLWDASRRRPAATFTVTEKNSVRREVRPCAALRAAIDDYVRSLKGRYGPEDHVFAPPHRRRMPPARRTVARALARLCADAGVPRVNPHAFRRYVVTHLRERGLPVEVACKFLGHRTQQTQDAHYWREDVERLAAGVVGQTDRHTVRGLQRLIQERRDELAALRLRADQAKQRRAPPPVIAGTGIAPLDNYFRTMAS